MIADVDPNSHGEMWDLWLRLTTSARAGKIARDVVQ